MNKRLTALLGLLFSVGMLWGQVGGQQAFTFLRLSPSARLTGLGGHLLAVQDDDLTLAAFNPAVLNAEMKGQMTFNHNFYLGGITHGYAAYGFRLPKADLNMQAGIQYVSYGTFDARDVQAVDMGSFNAAEYALLVGVGRQLSERLSAGANLRLISSQLEGFNSYGATLDLSALYRDTSSRFTASFSVRNAGAQISAYDDRREPLPFTIEAGISKRLEHLPFRFSITAIRLEQWNIRYDDPNAQDDGLLFGEAAEEESAFSVFTDNLFRHLVFGGEFLFGKKENFNLRFAYKHLRRAEWRLDNLRSMAGFSLGLGIKVNRFRLNYGLGFYGTGVNAHHLGISTRLSEFR